MIVQSPMVLLTVRKDWRSPSEDVRAAVEAKRPCRIERDKRTPHGSDE